MAFIKSGYPLWATVTVGFAPTSKVPGPPSFESLPFSSTYRTVFSVLTLNPFGALVSLRV